MIIGRRSEFSRLAGRAGSIPPRLEPLEQRILLSAVPSYDLQTLASVGFEGYPARPAAGLVMDAAGNLFGTTEAGGANGSGSVFEIAAGSNSVTTLISFNGADGAAPVASLILNKDGNLYGTTSAGGASGDGTVFENIGSSGKRVLFE